MANSGFMLSRVISVRRPPSGMASMAFRTRLWKTWSSRSSSARIGGQARIVAPHDRARCAPPPSPRTSERDALEELVHVERHEPQRHRPPQVEQHLDDPVDAVHLLEQHVGVLAPARLVAELALQELHGAADGAERVADLVGEADGHLAGRGQRLAAAHLGLELAQPRDVADHRHRRLTAPLAAASGAVTMLTWTAGRRRSRPARSVSERLSPVVSVSPRCRTSEVSGGKTSLSARPSARRAERPSSASAAGFQRTTRAPRRRRRRRRAGRPAAPRSRPASRARQCQRQGQVGHARSGQQAGALARREPVVAGGARSWRRCPCRARATARAGPSRARRTRPRAPREARRWRPRRRSARRAATSSRPRRAQVLRTSIVTTRRLERRGDVRHLRRVERAGAPHVERHRGLDAR